MAGTTPPEHEVRAVVATVVDSVLDERADETTTRPAIGTVEEDPAELVTPSGKGSAPLADVAVGGDHGGFHLKQRIAAELREHGFTVHDCGTDSAESVDYPDFAHTVAGLVAQGGCRWGIVVDGAGIGSAVVANKVPGVRAAACWDVSSARNSREHNHANVLALGAGLLGENLALHIVQAWLSTAWGGGRHARRVAKIAEIERRYLKDGVP